jgi:tetratricopeptide (TPR) repeat protein
MVNMKRTFAVIALLSGLVLVSQSAFSEQVRYYDPLKKAVVTVSGKIEKEEPAKVTIQPTIGAKKDIPAEDIVDITYDLTAFEYKLAGSRETSANTATDPAKRRDALAEAISSFEAVLPKVDATSAGGRHVKFKIAQLKARLAQENPDQVDPAIQALTEFKTNFPNGWQVFHSSRLLASLLMAKQEYLEAQKTYDDLAQLPGISKTIKQECAMMAAQALTKAKRYAEAEKRLQDTLRDLPPTDPQASKVKVYLSACKAGTGQLDEAVKELEGIIARVADPNLKALAYNTLGDCYLADNRPRDAMWQFLWVDIVYNQDRAEHARAVEQLAKIFEEQNDEEKAKTYKDKLATFKQ